MRVLVDTNILVRSAQPNHPLWSQSTRAVSKLIRQNGAVFFCSQNIAEFWNVTTRPAALNGLGLSHEEALREVSSIERLLTLLPEHFGFQAIRQHHRAAPLLNAPCLIRLHAGTARRRSPISRE